MLSERPRPGARPRHQQVKRRSDLHLQLDPGVISGSANRRYDLEISARRQGEVARNCRRRRITFLPSKCSFEPRRAQNPARCARHPPVSRCYCLKQTLLTVRRLKPRRTLIQSDNYNLPRLPFPAVMFGVLIKKNTPKHSLRRPEDARSRRVIPNRNCWNGIIPVGERDGHVIKA